MKFKALATDYDGTIAHHGQVDAATMDALQRLRDAGLKVILVTGREITDLYNVFPEPRLFDLIVGENGALLHDPLSGADTLLAERPPAQFADALRRRGVKDLSVGKVIVATLESSVSIVQNVIAEMNLSLEIILNKGSVMILPRGVHKAFGLTAALRQLQIDPKDVAAVGDAENDHPLLQMCGFGVAVANALPELKQRADWVTENGHGAGVRELIDRMLRSETTEVRMK
jgi:phosphoglycolate phosphatase (TIGR01487 family)